MHEIKEILDVLNASRHLGYRQLDSGTQLIGRVPHVAPEAWFHRIFTGLNHGEIKQLREELHGDIPQVFQDFLKQTNGISIFSGSLSIYGLRTNFARTGDAIFQPFSLVTSNRLERPPDAHPSMFFIGGFKEDGSRLYIHQDNLNVYRCTRSSVRPLNDWWNLWDMLMSETHRLASLFDETGRRIDPNQSTLP